MPESKSLEMWLKINAAVNMQALGGLNKSLMGIAKNALQIGRNLVGIQAFEGVASYIKGMKEEAVAARAAQERINIALKNRKDLMKETGGDVSRYGEQLKNLAENMERTGVTAATNLQAGFAGLTAAGFHPDVIGKMSTGFEGMVIALKGIGASKDDVTSVSTAIRNFIKGTAPLPKMFNAVMTAQDKAKNSLKALGSEQARGKFVMELMERQAGRVGDAMLTSAGKAENAANQWKAIQRTLGEPFLDVQLAFSEAMGALATALRPAAEELSKMMTPAMQDFANWIRENTPAIQEFGRVFAGFIKTNWEAIKNGLIAIGVGLGAIGAWAFLASPMGLIAAGITAIGVAVAAASDWGAFTAGMQGIWDAIVGFDWAGTLAKIGEGFSKIGTTISEAFSKINWGDVGRTLGEGIGKIIPQAAQNFIQFASAIAGVIATTDWGVVGQNVLNTLSTVFLDIIPKLALGFLDSFTKEMTAVNWGDSIKGLLDEVRTWPQKIIEGLSGLGAAILKVFTDAFNAVVGAAGRMIGDVISTITGGIASFSGGGVEQAAARAVEKGKTHSRGTPTSQFGGIFSSPQTRIIAEAGPEMLLPLNNKQRSQGLLAQAMGLMGMKGMGGGGSISVSVAPNININGVNGAQAGTIAREVERAMEDPVREMLAQLRKARDEERRLSYV